MRNPDLSGYSIPCLTADAPVWDVGLAIIPGVLIISTLVMVLTFGPSSSGEYTGAAYEGRGYPSLPC